MANADSFRCSAIEGGWQLAGLYQRGDEATLADLLPHWQQGELILELGDLELEDGAMTADLISWLRQLLQAGLALRLIQPPQVLAHTLYRIDMLNHPHLLLVDPREEEPYG
jgi:hypothetical protein